MSQAPKLEEIHGLAGGKVLAVEIKNYRSIASTTLNLGDLTVLVGGNGAGKSNIVDVFRFVSECLTLGLYTALERRGGIQAVRHRIAGTGGNPRAVQLTFHLGFGQGYHGEYMFRISSGRGGTYRVGEERARVWTPQGYCFADIHLRNGKHRKLPMLDLSDFVAGERSPERLAKVFMGSRLLEASADLLALPLVGSMPAIRGVLESMRTLRTYSIAPDVLRDPQDADEGRVLLADGRNAASVWRNLEPALRSELIDLLAHAVPGIVDVRSVRYGKRRGLEFTQESSRGRNRFEAHQMSDGTLRLFGIFLAVLQPSASAVLAVEEPEVSIHLGALSALVSVIEAQSETNQIVLTTHSADLMDLVDVDAIRLVRTTNGRTDVGGVAEHSKAAIREQLFSPGALLRAGGLIGEQEPVASPVE